MQYFLGRACFSATLLAASLCAQPVVSFDGFCNYFEAEPPQNLQLSKPELQKQDRLTDMLLKAGVKVNFGIFAADVPTFAAAISGGKGYLLYKPLYVDQQTHDGRLSWSAFAILLHQVGHLSLTGSLTYDPEKRRQMELSADVFSGRTLQRLEATVSDAQSALQGRSDADEGGVYPPIQARLSAIAAEFEVAAARPKRGRPGTRPGGGLPGPAGDGLPGPGGDGLPSDSTTPGQPPRAGPPLPSFPWPPPEASAFARVPTAAIVGGRNDARLRDAADSLLRALSNAGYSESSFSSVPEGFALVCRMEQMDADGRPLPGDARWSASVRLQSFCLSCYLKALLTANPGHFRVVVFIVSSQPFSQTDIGVTAKDAQAWLESGFNELPNAIGAQPFTADHVCTALIYEFELTEGEGAPKIKLPSSIPGVVHLARAGIWP